MFLEACLVALLLCVQWTQLRASCMEAIVEKDQRIAELEHRVTELTARDYAQRFLDIDPPVAEGEHSRVNTITLIYLQLTYSKYDVPRRDVIF